MVLLLFSFFALNNVCGFSNQIYSCKGISCPMLDDTREYFRNEPFSKTFSSRLGDYLGRLKSKNGTDWDSVKTNIIQGTDLATKVVSTIKSGFTKDSLVDLAGGILSFGALWPGPIGAAFAGASMIFTLTVGNTKEAAKPDPLIQEIGSKLNDLGAAIDAVMDAIKEVRYVVQYEIAMQGVKKMTADVYVMDDIFKGTIRWKTLAIKSQFLRKCDEHLLLPFYFRNLIVNNKFGVKNVLINESSYSKNSNNGLPYLDYNKKKYQEFVASTNGLFLSAMNMNARCAGARYSNDTLEEQEKQKLEVTENLKNYTADIAEAIDKDDFLRYHPFLRLIEKEAIADMGKTSHMEFSDKVMHKLVETFPYVIQKNGFFVFTSWSDPLNSNNDTFYPDRGNDRSNVIEIQQTKFQTHYEIFFHHWLRKWNRNMFFSMKSQGVPDSIDFYWKKLDFVDKARTCMNEATQLLFDPRTNSMEGCNSYQYNLKQCFQRLNLSFTCFGCMSSVEDFLILEETNTRFNKWLFQKVAFRVDPRCRLRSVYDCPYHSGWIYAYLDIS